MKYLVVLGLLFSFTAYGVTPVKKGDIAQSDGYLFSSDEEKKLRQINEENITLKDLQAHQEQKVQILDERVKNYAQYVEEQKKLGAWEKTAYVGLGIVGTVGALYLSSVILKNSK